MLDRIVVTGIFERDYDESTAERFLSQCYLDFREKVPEPDSIYDQSTKDHNFVDEVFPEMY